MHGDEAQQESREPEDERQKRESLSSLPLSARVAATEGKARPAPGRTTASVVEPGHEETEDSGPTSSED